jgi:GntR family transcriptional regulator/MocR family aminotransferase
MYLTLALPEEQAVQVRERAAREGVDVPLLSGYARTHPRSGLVVGFGGISDAELSHALEVLTRALDRR